MSVASARSKTLRIGLLVLLAAWLASCGGGGGSIPSPSPTPSPVITVSVSPLEAIIVEGSTQQFTVTLTGTSNTQVTWSVDGSAGGSATAGQINSEGLYTAPPVPPSPNVVTVTAASVENPARTGSASVSIVNPSPTVSSISPSAATTGGGDLTLSVEGTDFAPQSTVLFGSTSLATVYGGPTRLTALVPASGLTSFGTFPVTVTTPSPGGGTSASVTFTVNQAPAITSADSTTFTASTAGSFQVTATGFPTPTFNQSGALPSGVTFNAITGVLAGSPIANTGGIYGITFTASNGVGGDSVQAFTLTVNQAPAILSGSNTTFMAGTAGSFTVTATGYPTPTVSESGPLPPGVVFNASAHTLSGTAASGGIYPISFRASNGVGTDATQNFLLTVDNPPPTMTSISPVSHSAGGGSFTLTVMGSSYVPGSIVRWNGANRATTWISSSELRAVILSSDLATAGTAAVAVFNPPPAGGASATLPFSIMDAAMPVEVHLNLFEVDNGPQVPDASKATVGTNLSINSDDDDKDDSPDNSDALINGSEDRRDMARLELNVQPWDAITGVISVTADASAAIRVFNEHGQAVVLPETIDPARFNAGPIGYYAEGLTANDVILTLRYTEGSTVMEDKVKLTIGRETVIRLTFDDGPETDNGYSQKILDSLAANPAENNIKATFFVQTHVEYRGGSPAGQAMMTAEHDAGHHVEVHTGSTEDHIDHTVRVEEPPYDVDGDGSADGQNALESDMIRAKSRILDLTGQIPVYVRPPYLSYNSKVLDTYQRVSLTMQLWDVDSGDSDETCQISVDCIKDKLTTQIQFFIDPYIGKQDLIVIFHDIQPITANNLGAFLKAIQDAVQHKGRNVRFSPL